MIIFWPQSLGGGSTTCDFPIPGDVRYSVEYDNGDKVGTYLPTFLKTSPSQLGLPNVNDALLEWFQKMTFILITKETVGFELVETTENLSFMGVWQNFKPSQLMLKPEGQRSWNWIMLHSDPSLQLKNDDVVSYEDVKYRVMFTNDYAKYGYMEYHLVEDWVLE